jgi:hypothetical protein
MLLLIADFAVEETAAGKANSAWRMIIFGSERDLGPFISWLSQNSWTSLDYHKMRVAKKKTFSSLLAHE